MPRDRFGRVPLEWAATVHTLYTNILFVAYRLEYLNHFKTLFVFIKTL